jgi:hypothetical protein
LAFYASNIVHFRYSYPQMVINDKLIVMSKRHVIRQLAWTVFIFSFAGWVYIVLNSEVHMYTLSWPLTHFFRHPREDTFGEICFLVSFISYLVYNLLKPELPTKAK